MQVHGPSESLDDDSGIRVHLNPGDAYPFAVMQIGHVTLYIHSTEECDWLIKAAVDAKRLLTGEPEPEFCTATTDLDDTTLLCEREYGHPGSHHAPGPDEGSEVAWGDEWRQGLTEEIRRIAIGGE
jgi:hypothetical protein